MTGVVKPDYSPKKGKENKNVSNHIPTLKKMNAMNDAKNAPCSPKSERVARIPTEKVEAEETSVSSTSDRSVRPQTKILRRPTPNLQHPVIQLDSDDSSGSDKSQKEEDSLPKRIKMGSSKNFIEYNKMNVDRNTKRQQEAKSAGQLVIPNPCNSCSRSQLPERLHSHARKDARGLMNRRSSPALVDSNRDVKVDSKASDASDVKMTSPILESKSQATTGTESKALNSDVKMTSSTLDSKPRATGTDSKALNFKVLHQPEASDVKMASPTLSSKSRTRRMDLKASPSLNTKVPPIEPSDVKMISLTFNSKSQVTRMDSKTSPEGSDVKMTTPAFKSQTTRSDTKAPPALGSKMAPPEATDVKMVSPTFKSKAPSSRSDSKLPSPSTTKMPAPESSDVKMVSPTFKPKPFLMAMDSRTFVTKVSPSETFDIKLASPTLKPKVTSTTTDKNVSSTTKVTSPEDAPDTKTTSSTSKPRSLTVSGAKMASLAFDIKMASPRKKALNRIKGKTKGLRRSSSADRIKDASDATPVSEDASPSGVEADGQTDCARETAPAEPPEESIEPVKACYICQGDFKVSTLLLHESKCLENWRRTNNALSPHLRQLPPRRPPDESACGEAVHQAAHQAALEPCELCGRTFFPERLPVHRRVCKGRPSPLRRTASLREPSSASSTDGEEGNKPVPLYQPCSVCQRSFGTWVLAMHEQQCLRKWERENERLAEEESQNAGYHIEEDVASLAELGDHAWESHLQQLVPCPRCGRTFFPDRLVVHERSCKGERRPRSNRAA